MAEFVRLAGTALIMLAAVLSVGVVVVHQLLARWWRNAAGRHVFTHEAVLALVLSLWALRLAVPEGDWFLLVRLAAFALVPVVLAWRLVIIIQTWRRGRRRNGGSDGH